VATPVILTFYQWAMKMMSQAKVIHLPLNPLDQVLILLQCQVLQLLQILDHTVSI